MRDLLESLNYIIHPISTIVNRDPSTYRSLCFREWIKQFEQLKKTNKLYYCMNAPTLTEEQSIFMLNILYICPDFKTFKEAMEQYINSNR